MMWILKINSETLLVEKKSCRVSNLRIWFYGLSLLAFMRCLICVFVMVKSGLMVMFDLGIYQLMLYSIPAYILM